jgi:hypothetical protein
MKVVLSGSKSKHPFGKMLDTERMFVMRCSHDEHRFDPRPTPRRARIVNGNSMPAMTALWLAPAPGHIPQVPARGRQGLRTVAAGGCLLPGEEGGCDTAGWSAPPLTVVPDGHPNQQGRRRTSPAVRRRRTLLAMMGLLLIGLALPLGGTGGLSHPTGSVLAGKVGPVEYTVQPGDSLWSIAQRVDPAADPRPLVAKLASQTGSDRVVPGERIVLP